jgi:hypothetical protein
MNVTHHFHLSMDCFRQNKKNLRLKKKPPNISPDRRLRTQCYAELYAVLWDVCGSVVDSWVRGGTRAVPSQCSGPSDSFSAGPGFEPGTLCDSPHVSNHLATRAGHERWRKNVPLIQTLHYVIIKKPHELGIEPLTSRSSVWVFIHQTTPNTWVGIHNIPPL